MLRGATAGLPLCEKTEQSVTVRRLEKPGNCGPWQNAVPGIAGQPTDVSTLFRHLAKPSSTL